MTTIAPPSAMVPFVTTLPRLYAARFGFAAVWAVLLAAVAPGVPPLLRVLLVLYPLVDAVGVLVELRIAGSPRSRPTAIANIVVSVAAAIALLWAGGVGVGAVLGVWGVWAVLAGATQLLTGLSRRRTGGQLSLILSGGLSVLVGFGFLAQGLGGATGVASIAGYAAVGGVFFLVAAIRIGRAGRRS